MRICIDFAAPEVVRLALRGRDIGMRLRPDRGVSKPRLPLEVTR